MIVISCLVYILINSNLDHNAFLDTVLSVTIAFKIVSMYVSYQVKID